MRSGEVSPKADALATPRRGSVLFDSSQSISASKSRGSSPLKVIPPSQLRDITFQGLDANKIFSAMVGNVHECLAFSHLFNSI
jgi:hypothetical protein